MTGNGVVALKKLVLFVLQIDLALWLGATVYFSFLAANNLFGGLPIDSASTAISLLFPPYFTYVTILSIVGWLLYWTYGQQSRLRRRSFYVGHIALVLAVVVAVVNRVFLLPVIHRLTVEMGPVSQANPQLFQRFGMLHGISMSLDLISILTVLIAWVTLTMNLQTRAN